MHIIWNRGEKIAAIAAVLLSIPALVISGLSWSAAKHATELAEQDFASVRMLVLQGEYDAKEDTFKLLPVGDNATLQRCTIFFPPSLNLDRIEVSGPDFEFPVSEVKYQMQNILNQTIHRPPKDHSLVSLNNDFPVCVEASYIAKGQLLHICSIYNLNFELEVSDHISTPPHIEFKNMLLLGNVISVPPSMLDTIWRIQIKAYINNN